MKFAGFWRRAAAVMIDLALSAPLYVLLAALDLPKWGQEAIYMIVLSALYAAFFAGRWQASPGMRAMHVMIVDTEGRRISYTRALWWVVTSVAGMAIAFGAILWLQTRFDVEKVNEASFAMMAGDISPDQMMAQVEAVVGMPYVQFYGMLVTVSAITFLLCLVWMLSVAAGRQKAGFHNRICGTRLVVSRSLRSPGGAL